MAKKITYTESMQELEAIVEKLQNEEVEIDELKTLVARSAELLNFCKKTLHETDEDIKKMIENLD
ncbi:MAG: exodeoxyribonuclease VII small subunit [Bacteroidales bacterium]|jgi:exodeoxyribonuclease VII small subunit